MWTTFINFLSGILTGINNITGNFGLSVVLFTILMRVALLPLDLKAKASTKRMNELQPEIKKINEKYKNDPDKKNKKTMELYQKHKVNPLGGCLPMLIQLPVFFALFAALRAIASQELYGFLKDLILSQGIDVGNILDQSKIMADYLPRLFSDPNNERLVEDLVAKLEGNKESIVVLVDTIKNITPEEVIQFLNSPQYNSFRFLWIKNIWIADSPMLSVSGGKIAFFQGGMSGPWNGLFILPALAGITSYLQMKYANPGADNQQTKGFSTIFPLMSIWFTSMYTAAFAVYWVTSNIFQIVQQTIYNYVNSKQKPVKEGAEK